ncbi:efflux RND transporter permease subunit [Roseofilum sp. BLCC_M154]|uniref:Efflux RND transporter permease subunit n=1 Tax=Roseofilum acuticapitatum BLCC-M154 TaxID=3022444 RepID=A0ABT7AM59_9CYAN|nr:efflux RND transporter permease subunit [Roseofilum acuticapitatum]MDJ1167960.1 efflux RND transporter permease subunit [Roseofilum acuticapitatum BLCC-M154]
MLLSIADNFIKRPVLTTVCSILIVLVGGISLPLLPISQLPQLANTEVQVTASYIGADVQTAETTTTTIIEREINGVENMKYMYSNTNNGGLTSIRVAFPQEVDRDIAQVNVQNRVSIAEPQLPAEVKQTGVKTDKASPNILLVLGFSSERDESGNYFYDEIFMSNYIDLNILDQLKRLPGVGQATLLGDRKYAMRIWLDPNKMAARGLAASDVVNALREQNLQVGAGKIGQAPSPDGQLFEIPLQATGRFADVSEFEELVVKVGSGGTLVKLKDVAQVELGAQDYTVNVLLNTNPGVGIAIYQLPGSNALETAQAVKSEMERLSVNFPPGMNMVVAYDTTTFINKSLEEVVITLFQAIGLVILILFVFLQDWRSTLVPAIAIPVALIGAAAGLKIVGFEINTLTLFAFTLASGLVVDDAIVIVEAVSSKIEEGMQARQAALDAMEELTGATIATSAVLMAVFIPVSFFPGTTGIIYKQFALTIAFAVACSTFNALTFSPTMSALLLRRKEEPHGPLAWLFNQFNRGFGWVQARYGNLIQFLTRINALVIGVFIIGLVATVWMYNTVPSGFVPEEDQGYFLVIYQAPDGVSLDYTAQVAKKVEEKIRAVPEVAHTFGATGYSFDGQDPSKGIFFVNLKSWDERPTAEQSIYGILRKVNRSLGTIPEVFSLAVNAPPVQGMGNTGGFEFQLQDRTGNATIQDLLDNANRLIGAVNSDKYPAVAGAYTQFTANKAQKKVEVLRDRAKALNVDVNEVFATLATYLGSSYVNDFVLGQRQYRVYVQADAEYRSDPEDINQLYVRSREGTMVPLGSLIKLTEFTGPEIIQHFNVFRSIKIQGGPAPGYSSGQAIAAMEQAASEVLDPGFGYSWQGTALEEKASGGSAPIIFGLGFIMVFLVLAAQYESYIDPTIIMLSVPLSVLGALSAIWFRANMVQAGGIWPVVNNDVYCQVALVMLIGLASKNSILIVEFANQLHEKGLDFTRAATQAAEQRFRPIQMTAFSTLVGFWPLVTASGAGSSSRWSLGTAIFGGMLVGTVLSLLITPNLYIAVKNLEAFLLKGERPQKPPKSNGGSGRLGRLGNLSGLLKKPLAKNGHSNDIEEERPDTGTQPESQPEESDTGKWS